MLTQHLLPGPPAGPGQGCARGSGVGGDPGGAGSTVTGLVWIGGSQVGQPSEVLQMPAAACASGFPGPGFSGRGLGRKPFTHMPHSARKSCQLCACGCEPLCLPLPAGGSAGPGPSGPRSRSLALPPGLVLHGEPPTPVLVLEMLVWGASGQDLLFWMLPSDCGQGGLFLWTKGAVHGPECQAHWGRACPLQRGV